MRAREGRLYTALRILQAYNEIIDIFSNDKDWMVV